MANVEAIAAIDNELWEVSDKGAARVAHLTDRGWIAENWDTIYHPYEIDFADAATGYILATDTSQYPKSFLMRSIDSGRTWTNFGRLLNPSNLACSSSTLLVTQRNDDPGASSALISFDSGVSFTKAAPSLDYHYCGSATWLCGKNISVDNGDSWFRTPQIGDSNLVRQFGASSKGVAFAMTFGDSAILWRSLDYGNNWSSVALPGKALRRIWVALTGTAYAAVNRDWPSPLSRDSMYITRSFSSVISESGSSQERGSYRLFDILGREVDAAQLRHRTLQPYFCVWSTGKVTRVLR